MLNKYYRPYGGGETYLRMLEEHLLSQGHEVCQFSMSHERNWPSAQSRFFVTQVDYQNLNRYSLPQKARFAARLLYSVEARRNLRRLLRQTRPDIAHIHNIYHQISPSVLPELKHWNVPTVMTLHDYKLLCPVYTLFTEGAVCERCRGGHYYQCLVHRCAKGSFAYSALNMVEAYLHRWLRLYERGVDHYIAVSEFMRAKCIEFGMPAQRITCIPATTRAEAVTPTYRDEGYGLAFGRITAYKGIDTLVTAAEGIRNVPVYVCGRPDDDPEVQRMVARTDYHSVRFLGFVPDERLRTLLANARFVVIPSVWYENCSSTVLEAMVNGKAVIASRIGGLPEQIVDGESGFLFDPGNAADLRMKIAILAADPARATAMGRRARQIFETKYNPRQRLGEIVQVYRNLLATRRAPRN